MNCDKNDVRPRHSSGFVTLGKVLLVLCLFGAYTGYKFLPAFNAKSQIERAVEGVIDGKNHRQTDDYLKHNIARRAATASLELDKDAIEITRETRPGQRIFHVAVHHPITVNYLGAERTFADVVRLTHVVRVDESTEARFVAQTQRQAERQRLADESMARRIRNVDGAWADCEAKHGKGGCEVSTVPGTSGDEVIRDF